MPPFGNSDLLFLHSNSFLKDHTLDRIEDNDEQYEILRSFQKRVDEVGYLSPDLHDEIKFLLEKAAKLNAKIKTCAKTTLADVVDHSIGSIVVSTMDRLADLLGSEEKVKPVLRAIVSESVSRSLASLEKLEDLALGPLDETLDQRLRHLLEDQDLSALQTKVAVMSSIPSFEFLAGESESKFHARTPESLPLHVTVTPFIVVNAGKLLRLDDNERLTTKYKVKIGNCYHAELFRSSTSGIVGEARVQVHVTPTNDTSNKKVCVFDLKEDVARPSLVDVRACQKNVFPKKIQTRLDVYTSTVFGNKSLTLTMKMRTHTTDDGNTSMDVQLLLDPVVFEGC